jgi:hypothetical protein
VERSSPHLKDHLLPKNIYVKGYEKVFLILTTGDYKSDLFLFGSSARKN